MRGRCTLPVVLVLTIGSLAGCGGVGSPAPKSSSASSSSSSPASSPASSPPSSSAPASPSGASTGSSPATSPATSSAAGAATSSSGAFAFPRDRTEATSLHKAVLVRNAARTTEEQAVVDAWMAFWQGAADTYYFYRPSKQFAAVASGPARTAVLRYMRGNKAKNQRVVGWARDNVLAVKVSGDSATIHDCTENYTFTVDEEGEPLTVPPPFYDTTGSLQRVDGRWRVVQQDSRQAGATCLR